MGETERESDVHERTQSHVSRIHNPRFSFVGLVWHVGFNFFYHAPTFLAPLTLGQTI